MLSVALKNIIKQKPRLLLKNMNFGTDLKHDTFFFVAVD